MLIDIHSDIYIDILCHFKCGTSIFLSLLEKNTLILIMKIDFSCDFRYDI